MELTPLRLCRVLGYPEHVVYQSFSDISDIDRDPYAVLSTAHSLSDFNFVVISYMAPRNLYKDGCACPAYSAIPGNKFGLLSGNVIQFGSERSCSMRFGNMVRHSMASNRTKFIHIQIPRNENRRWEGAPSQYRYPVNK